MSLVPLPSVSPVNSILDTYFEEEKGKRRLGSAEADLLEEVVMGMKDYFEACLGRVLLYRFERQQYFETRQAMEKAEGDWAGKSAVGDVYGAEHLLRLFGMCIARMRLLCLRSLLFHLASWFVAEKIGPAVLTIVK